MGGLWLWCPLTCVATSRRRRTQVKTGKKVGDPWTAHHGCPLSALSMGKTMVSGTYILGTRHVAGIEIQDPGSEAGACFHVTKDLNSWIRGKTSNLWHRSLRSLTLLETSFPKCLGMCGLSSQRELCIPSTRCLEFEISTPQKAEGWDPSTFSLGLLQFHSRRVEAVNLSSPPGNRQVELVPHGV